jgi:hypothetical protein
MSFDPCRRRGNGVAGARARQGPADPHRGTRRDFLRRHETAQGSNDMGFDELPPIEGVRRSWRLAYLRWVRCRVMFPGQA